MKRIILASASPRRRELTARLGLTFEVITADIDESADPSLTPAGLVLGLAKRKAEAVANTLTGEFVVIAADTLVALDGRVLGKPRDENEAKEMLRSLSGRSHEVFTGLAIIDDTGKTSLHAERTEVKFRPLSEGEIDFYIASREPLDKAGAYGIQGIGGAFVSGIVGDYYNVVGLPVCTLCLELAKFGITPLSL